MQSRQGRDEARHDHRYSRQNSLPDAGHRLPVVWSPLVALVALVALTLAGYGDGVRAAYTIAGIDPLGVLELKVRPNVIVVLDSSGSMQWSSNGQRCWGRGPSPRPRCTSRSRS